QAEDGIRDLIVTGVQTCALPICYRHIADQLVRRVVTLDDFAYGVRRFVIGLAKKVLIANVVAGPADTIFAMPLPELSAAHAWLRSEERRVGKEGTSRWAPITSTK